MAISRDKNMYVVILAGGSGTRFWPVSRQSYPKQFLNITGKGSLLVETLSRVRPIVSGAHVVIVTNKVHRRMIARQAAAFHIPMGNILLEPKGKNTAPAICFAAAKIHQINPKAVIAVLPSDHLIQNQERFLKVLSKAVRLAKDNHLVTLGIIPTRPETGYGYLQTTVAKFKGRAIIRVKKFTEKPSFAKAKQFTRRKNYYWNSGMFIFKSSVILDEFKKHLPKVYRLIGIKTSTAHINKVWGRLPHISIDYGILEKADNVVAVPAKGIQWSDLGSFESLAEVIPGDQNGNIVRGDVILMNCANTLVWADKKMVAGIGLEDAIVIDTPDALLICRKNKSQNVRSVVTLLEKRKRTEIL